MIPKFFRDYYIQSVLALICVTGSGVSGQGMSSISQMKPDLEFKQFLSNLSQSHIRCIEQDSLGFIWIGTHSGLNRFDGINFEIYETNEGDSTSLNDNRVLDLVIDKKNNLWVANFTALVRYDYQKNNFQSYHFEDSGRFDVQNLCVDAENKLWVGTQRGIHQFDETKAAVTSPEYSSLFKLKNLLITKIITDRAQRLWIGTSHGLYVFIPEQNRVEQISLSEVRPVVANVSDIIQDYRGDFWISTQGDGLFRIQGDPLRKPLVRRYNDDQRPHSLQSDRIYSLLQDRDHRLWVGTEDRGLNVYIPELDGFVAYQKSEYEKTALKSNSIWEIFQDDAKRLWIGTYDQGVFLHDWLARKFSAVDPGFGQQVRLKANTVTSFLENRDNLWIGTDGGGISVWDRHHNTYDFINTDTNSGLQSDAVLTLFRDSEGINWIGTWGGGVSQYDSVTRRFKTFLSEAGNKNTIGSNNVFAVDEDAKGDLWMANWGAGVTRYRKSDGSFLNIDTGYGVVDSLPKRMTYDVEVDDLNGHIWVATLVGLDLIKFSNDSTYSIERFPAGLESSESVSGDHINCIYEDSKNRIWIGCNKGLNLFNRHNNTFTKFFKKSGLPGNLIKAIIEDQAGQLWITTEKGVARMIESASGWKIECYGKIDGLQEKEFFINSAYRTYQGEIFIGGNSGYNYFYPDKVKPNLYVPKLQFTGFRLFNEEVPIGEDGSPLQNYINSTESVILTHDQSVFTIEYQGVHFTHPEDNQYAFILKGFENDWNQVGSQTTATYTNLDPGEYTFKVKVANSDGIWAEDERQLSVTVLPPWYQTWWARLLLISSITCLILSALQIRLSVIKRQNRNLENEVALRTAEVLRQKNELERQAELLEKTNQQKNRLFSIISHDLRSPLTSLQAITGLLDPSILKEEDIEHTRTEISRRINNLGDTMVGLLNWAKQQLEGEKYHPESFDLHDIGAEMIKLYEEKTSNKNIGISNQVRSQSLVYGDINQVRTIFRNLIGNSIKFTKPGGEIKISCQPSDRSEMIISVRDTGVGMESDQAGKLFNDQSESTLGTSGEKGVGLGLLLVREFVEKNSGQIWVESELGVGTNFLFTLPLGKQTTFAEKQY